MQRLKDWKYHLLKTTFALIIVGSLSIAIPQIGYWICRVFNISLNDTTTLSIILFVFGMTVWFMLSTETTQEVIGTKLGNWVGSKLERYELRTRHQVRVFLFRIGIVISMGTLLYGLFGTLAGEKHMLFIDIFLIGLFLMLVSSVFISDKDIALFFFRKFKDDKHKDFEDLRRALKRYNRSVDFRFSAKELSYINQYVIHAYSLNLEECKKDIDTRLNEIIESLENRRFGQIPDVLVLLSTYCHSFIEKYRGLGIEIRPSRWMRAKEQVSSSLLKILPQLFWLLILIAIYLILKTFIQIEIPMP